MNGWMATDAATFDRQTSDGARWWPLILLAAGNAGRSWVRLLPMMAIGAFVIAAALHLSAGALDTHLATEHTRQRNGSTIIIGRSQLGVDAAACERLDGIDAVRHAGWMRASENPIEVRPGVQAPLLEASPGMTRLLTQRNGAVPAQTYGDGLAGRIGVRSSNTVGVLEGPGIRSQQVTSSVLVTTIAGSRVDECWVETRPETHLLAPAMIEAALVGSSPDLQISDLVFDSGPRPYDGLNIDLVAVTAGLLVGLVASLTVRLRRIDLAMHRLIGFTGFQTWTVMMLEVGLVMFTGAVAGTGVWLGVAGATSTALQRPVLATAAYVAAGALVTAVLIAGVTSAVMNRRSSQLMVLREGA